MRSVRGLSIGKAMFKLYDQPPYPIASSRYANVMDTAVVNLTVNALYKKYDTITFNELSWAYWYAMCAPLHTSAVHFGGLIEMLQKSGPTVDRSVSKLLDKSVWKSVQDAVKAVIKNLKLGDVEKAIILNKTSNLNQAPQNVILTRTFESMGLSMSPVEINAWQHRNSAAHGDMNKDPIDLILNSKVMRLVFHRLLAGITYCSDRYVDYYSYNFPTRPISQSIPPRDN